MGIDPGPLPEQGLSPGSLVTEPKLLVDVPRSGIESVDGQLNPVQMDPLECVAQDQLERFGAQAAAKRIPTGQKNAEPARASWRIEGVEDGLPDPRASRAVDNSQIEAAQVCDTGGIPPFQLRWGMRLVSSRESSGLRIKVHQPW